MPARPTSVRSARRPGTRPRKADVLTEFRRGALLGAARHVFGAAGFEKATVEAIAREADVAKGTVYLYYPSKEAIYDAAIRDCMGELDRLTRARIAGVATLEDAIATFITTRVEFFQAHQDCFRMYVGEMAAQLSRPPGRRTTCRTMFARQREPLERAIAAAVDRGEVRPVDIEATATVIFDMTRGLVSRYLLSQGRSDPVRDARFLTDLIWTGLAPGNAPA